MKKSILISGIIIASIIATYGCNNMQTGKTHVEAKKEVSFFIKKSSTKLPEYHLVNSRNIYENLMIIYPDNERGAALIAKSAASEILKNKKIEAKVIKESEVTKADLLTYNLMIIGNTSNSLILKEMSPVLPVKANGETVVVGEKTYTGKDIGVTFFYPNLYNYNNTMILVMGNTETALKTYDFITYDIAVVKGTKEISSANFKEVAFGKFDREWKVAKVDDVAPKLLAAGDDELLDPGPLKEYPFPEWAKGKTIYQVFVRSFYDSDGNGRGDLKGVTAKLDYLEKLGVDIIWLMPIFDSPTYHGYDTKDYFTVNKEYGTNEDFSALAQELHKRGMKVILDVAFNHCAKSESHFRDALGNPDSKYDRWFYFYNLKNTIYNNWYFREDVNSREVIAGSMPAWNTNNPEVVDFHASVAKFWMDPNGDGDTSDGCDGFRLDYVKGPSHEYWKSLRQKIKAIRPDALMLGEIWLSIEDMVKYFDNQLDSGFDFGLQGSATTGVIKDIMQELYTQDKLLPKNVEMTRFLSNHDLDRFPTYKKSFELKLVSTLVYTLGGMECIYYGDELGMKGDKGDGGDEGRRRPMEWYKDNKGPGMTRWVDVYDKNPDGISVEEQEGKEGSLLEHYKKLIKIRKNYIGIINENKRIDVPVMEEKDGKESISKKVIAYMYNKNGKQIIVMLNFGKEGEFTLDLSNVEGINGDYKEILNNKNAVQLKKDKVKIKLETNKPYIFAN